MTRRVIGLALAGLCLAPAAAVADHPFCSCRRQAETITCRAGFSDGETAQGALLEVIAGDGSTIQRMTFGADSTLIFRPPATDYHVLFDAGPGLTVEIEPREIR